MYINSTGFAPCSTTAAFCVWRHCHLSYWELLNSMQLCFFDRAPPKCFEMLVLQMQAPLLLWAAMQLKLLAQLHSRAMQSKCVSY